jgi:glycosyltransferase involved in cell wall biosynthesis
LYSQRLVSEDRIAVILNGIDVERFASTCTNFDRATFLAGKNIPADAKLVCSIGELRKLKRHDDLIRAAAIVREQVPLAHFVIAGVDTSGSGENQRELKQLAHDLKLNDRIHFLGWLDDADKLLCATDVFVSASETESFGLSIAEAMATSTAVVATRTEGAQEVVQDCETGLLVPIGDVAQIAAAIIRLLKDDEERIALGREAVDVARKLFSLERMVDDIERIYLEE